MHFNSQLSETVSSSVHIILQVLHAVLQQNYAKHNCFVESEEAFCGNKIVEENEQCDCGYEGDCSDQCCHPRDNTAKQCKLKTDAQCRWTFFQLFFKSFQS